MSCPPFLHFILNVSFASEKHKLGEGRNEGIRIGVGTLSLMGLLLCVSQQPVIEIPKGWFTHTFWTSITILVRGVTFY